MSGAELIQQYLNCTPEIAVGIEMIGAYAAYRGGKETLMRAKDWVMSDRKRIGRILASEDIAFLEKDDSLEVLLSEANKTGVQKRKERRAQVGLFAEEKEPETELQYPRQLELFDTDLNEAAEKAEKWRPPVPQILADREGKETALYLVSNVGLPEWNAKSIEAIRVARATRQALMKHFSLEGLRLYMLFNATRHDLVDALENPNIDHVIIRGHGGWSSWEDDSGFSTSSDYLSEHVDTDHKKKSFIRETCGRPLPFDEYEDQFGAAFSRETIGQATLAHVKDHAQIRHTLRPDFAKYKGMSGVEHDRLFDESQPLIRKVTKKLKDLGRWLSK